MAKRKNIETKNPSKGGRPTKYSKELSDRICEIIATTTDGLRRMCNLHPELPDPDTIRLWRHRHQEFHAQYNAAKLHQADLLAEDILDIADDDSRDIIEREGGETLNTEYVARSRLRMDARKWLASKLLPKAYGDKVQNETIVTFNHEKALEALK